MVKMIAIEPINGLNPGTPFECGDREAAQMEVRHLARRAAPAHANKMAQPVSNKSDPSEAAGETLPSAASRAARALQPQTPTPSKRGGPRKAKATEE